MADRLPSINSDEIFPTWWQLEAVDAVDFSANNCNDIDTGNNKWIIGNSLSCDFIITRGNKGTP